MAVDDYGNEIGGDKPKKKKKKPKTWRERRAAAKKKRSKQKSKAKENRANKRAEKTARVNAAANELRGGKDGAKLIKNWDDVGELNKWYEPKTVEKFEQDKQRRRAAEKGRQVKQGQRQADAVEKQIQSEKESRRAAQSANEKAEMRSREDYRKSAARKNTREYKRGQHLLKDPGRKERLAKFRENKARANMARELAKSAPKGATRNKYGTSFETPKERSTRKGQFTKTRRNAMRKKYAPKPPSPVSKTARQRARDINTMNRSEPKNTGNIYADKDLAREKKRISSKPTYRPPGSSNAEYKAVAKKAMAKKYGDNNAFVKKLGKGLSKFGRKIPVAGAVVSAAVGADPLEAFPGVVGKAGAPSTKKPKWKKPPGSRYVKSSKRGAARRPKPSTRPARNKPKPKKYNRKDTWG